MAPPKYGDLGKQANDVFSKGYHFGLLKLEVKTKTNTGVEFTTGGNSNLETGKVAGNLETKYQVKDLGMTLTEKWTTDNSLNTTVDVVDKVKTGTSSWLRGRIYLTSPFPAGARIEAESGHKVRPRNWCEVR